jgi:hypothetical protein
VIICATVTSYDTVRRDAPTAEQARPHWWSKARSASLRALLGAGLLATVAGATGCHSLGRVKGEVAYVAPAATPRAGATAPTLAADCKVWLQAFSDTSNTNPELTGQPGRRLDGDFTIISEPACLRRKDGLLVLPDHLVLHTNDDHRMCQEGTLSGSDNAWSCHWNLTFRHAYPLSFAIFTEDPKEQLASYLQMVRVFRNGTLAFRRMVDPHAGGSLIVPGQELKATLLPYDAPIDLRLVAVGVDVPPEVTLEEVAKRRRPLEERLEVARNAFNSSTLGRSLSSSRQQVDALVKVAEEASLAARCLAPTHTADPTCASAPADLKALSDNLHASLVSTDAKAAEQRSVAQKAVLEKTSELEQKLRTALFVAKAASTAELVQNSAADATIQQWLATLDALAQTSSELVNGTAVLVDGLRSTAATVRDKQAMYELYNHMAACLASQSVFEARNENPALVSGELGLPMKYSDYLQTFVLAPWNGLPTRPTEKLAADLNASIAIPIIDAVGVRYQFGRSRFADFRVAAGFTVFAEEVEQETKPSTTDPSNPPGEQSETVDAFHFAPQVNLSLGTLHLGAAYIATPGGDIDEGVDRLRLLIGADLVKLLTGRDLEAL